jgi:hypothetical protein
MSSDTLPPLERPQQHAEGCDVDQDLAEVDDAGTGEEPVRGAGLQNRAALILAIVVVTIGPCGALLVALGQADFRRDQPAEAAATTVAAAAPTLHLSVDDQPTSLPEALQARTPTAETNNDIAGKLADPSPKRTSQKTEPSAPARPIPKSYLSKTHPPRRGMTAAVAPVKTMVRDYEHGGPYARTGNGPGNFFSGDR